MTLPEKGGGIGAMKTYEDSMRKTVRVDRKLGIVFKVAKGFGCNVGSVIMTSGSSVINYWSFSFLQVDRFCVFTSLFPLFCGLFH